MSKISSVRIVALKGGEVKSDATVLAEYGQPRVHSRLQERKGRSVFVIRPKYRDMDALEAIGRQLSDALR